MIEFAARSAIALVVGTALLVGCGEDAQAPEEAKRRGRPAATAPTSTCSGTSTVSVTHAPPRSRLYDHMPMFARGTRRWTEKRARELLDVRHGPALVGVHVDHVRDLGTHHGVRFQAVPVAAALTGGPAECAPEYDSARAPPVPSVCLAWWPDHRAPRRTARDCSPWLLEGTALGTIPLSGNRTLAYWLLPAGRSGPVVVPTGRERERGRLRVRFRRVAGQLHLAVTSRWPSDSYDLRYVEDGRVVRHEGPSRP